MIETGHTQEFKHSVLAELVPPIPRVGDVWQVKIKGQVSKMVVQSIGMCHADDTWHIVLFRIDSPFDFWHKIPLDAFLEKIDSGEAQYLQRESSDPRQPLEL